MPSFFKTIFVVSALTLAVIVVSIFVFPEWRNTPVDLIRLGVGALAGVVLFLGGLYNARRLIERKDGESQTSIKSIGDETQNLQGTGDNIRANVVIKDSTVTIPPSSFILPTSVSAPPLPPSSAPPPPLSAAPSTPHALPAPPGDFTGRVNEVEKLKQQLAGGTRVAISGLAGMGGVGKTVLALFVANKLKQQYPDAQIMLDMKGTSRDPLSATDALTQVIHTFDPTADLRQATPEQTRALYLNLLDGERALLFFDNAADAAQVKPLIPPMSCAMLVTSRKHFVLPGMDTIRLDMLPESDARKLLLTICQRIGDHADEIAKLCGRLPLALRIAASALAEHIDLTPKDYAASLADRRTRIPKLKSESDPELDLQATFEYSYDLLSDDAKARLRALAIFPAPFGGIAAESLWALNEEETRKLLRDLVRFSLLDYDEATKRYSLHDLLTDFAGGRLKIEERDVAQLRHAQHYVQVASAANELYIRGGENVLLGLALFDSEWLHIRAGQGWAAANVESSEDAARLCSKYPDASVYCLNLRLLASDWVKWLESALAAARKLGDKQAEGYHLGNLGLAYRNLGNARKAIECHEQALAIAREINNRRSEGNQLGNLGLNYATLGETRKAIKFHKQSLAIARETSDRRSEGNQLGNLGVDFAALGDARKAIEYHEQALAIHHKMGDPHGKAADLGNLGNAYDNLGETHKAIEYYEQALVIAREIGDRQNESSWLGNLGNVYVDLGDAHKAIEYLDQALAISREIGDRRSEGQDLGNLGNAYHTLGETRKAIEYCELALEIFRQIEDIVSEAKTARLLEELRSKNAAG